MKRLAFVAGILTAALVFMTPILWAVSSEDAAELALIIAVYAGISTVFLFVLGDD